MDFGTAIVNGIPLVFVIAGLVAFAKTMGLTGKSLTILSLVLGLVFGVVFSISKVLPTGIDGWLGVVVYGLALGITTSGLYDLVKRDVLARPE